jgi:hypothetical protein
VHSFFTENPLIDLEVENPLFLRWFCHNLVMVDKAVEEITSGETESMLEE